MFDAKKLLDQFLGSQVPGARRLGPRSGRAMPCRLAKDNPLADRRDCRRPARHQDRPQVAGSALKLGGLAAIAGLGYQAYKNYQAGQGARCTLPDAQPPIARTPAATREFRFQHQPPASRNDFVLVLVRAMIAAARADGHIDDAERARIMDKVKVAGLERRS